MSFFPSREHACKVQGAPTHPGLPNTQNETQRVRESGRGLPCPAGPRPRARWSGSATASQRSFCLGVGAGGLWEAMPGEQKLTAHPGRKCPSQRRSRSSPCREETPHLLGPRHPWCACSPPPPTPPRPRPAKARLLLTQSADISRWNGSLHRKPKAGGASFCVRNKEIRS